MYAKVKTDDGLWTALSQSPLGHPIRFTFRPPTDPISLGVIHDRTLECDAKKGKIPLGRNKYFVLFFAHGVVHPPVVCHTIMKDLIVHALASVQQTSCEGGHVAGAPKKVTHKEVNG